MLGLNYELTKFISKNSIFHFQSAREHLGDSNYFKIVDNC